MIEESTTSSQGNAADTSSSTSGSTSNKSNSAAGAASSQGESYASSDDNSSQAPVADASGNPSADADADDSDAAVSSVVNKKSSSTQSIEKITSAHVTHASATAPAPIDSSSPVDSPGSMKGSGSPAPLPLGNGLPPDKDGPNTASSDTENSDSLPAQDGTAGALTTRAALPTAAIAVPLALVGATLVASLALWFAHRRALATQHAKNAQIVARATSVRSSRSRGSAGSGVSKRRGSIGDPDIEKAIGALYDSDRERERKPPLTRARYPIPKADVRRGQSYESRCYDYDFEEGYGADDRIYSDDDRDYGYFHERRSVDSHRTHTRPRVVQATYDRPRYIHHRSCDRLHSGRCSVDRAQRPVSRRDTHSAYAASHHSSIRSSGRRLPRESADDGNESTTESILTDYLPTSRSASRFGGSGAQSSIRSISNHPRLPPRTYTRRSAQDVDDPSINFRNDHRSVPRHGYRRKREVMMCSPHSDSHRTV